ncbi:hypothetical protein Nepgr_013259 [Nepenthes gracilis]|uniref:Uncharacterized protein n=1 Tax=Nepenthes gracilis TaxID=150966 RepID=A0AAD3SHI4_NEPGR|nr:hypothetical protein Nepgr_013259 [Nepenthes gracilis]
MVESRWPLNDGEEGSLCERPCTHQQAAYNCRRDASVFRLRKVSEPGQRADGRKVPHRWDLCLIYERGQAGLFLCWRPIIRSTIPSLCFSHFPKAKKNVARALKKAGLSIASSAKPASEFHLLVGEYVHQILAKRKKSCSEAQCRILIHKKISLATGSSLADMSEQETSMLLESTDPSIQQNPY